MNSIPTLSGFLKVLRVRALLLCCLTLGFASSAVAEEWRVPTGDFTITLPEGWRFVGEPAVGELVRFGPGYDTEEDKVHECNVSYSDRSAPGVTQDGANGVFENMNAETMPPGGPNAMRVRAFRSEMIEGVRVVTSAADQQDGDVYSTSLFGIAAPNVFRFYMLSCVIATPVEDAEVEALLELPTRLRFAARAP